MPRQITISDPNASPRQIAFIKRLVEERVLTDEEVSWTLDRVRAHESGANPIPKVLASRIIGQRGPDGRHLNGLLSKPVRPGYEKDHFAALPAGATRPQVGEGQQHAIDAVKAALNDPEPDVPEIIVPRRHMTPARIGIYQHGDNIYVVRKRRGSDRVSSFRLVESPPRLAANGKTVHHDWARDYRMVWVLKEEERITDDDAVRELNIKVGACVMCNHAIWQAKSVRRMMGTRCYKRVHGLI
jgi:hypothetical protein